MDIVEYQHHNNQSLDRLEISKLNTIQKQIIDKAFTGTKMNRPKWNKPCKGGPEILSYLTCIEKKDSPMREWRFWWTIRKRYQSCFSQEHYIDTSVYAENMRDKIELQGTDEIFKGLNNYFRKLLKDRFALPWTSGKRS